ncbi:MAG: AEC family transporter [Ignavibacteria bacterium]|nr:AEC family transporter [Ignavibacteria bacterium]
MANIILLFIGLTLGLVLQKVKSFPKDAYKVFNAIIINISLPALALLYIPQITINEKIIFPLASMWIVFGLSIVFFVILSRIFKWDKSTTGALIMTAGLCNSSFVGFPVLLTMFGEEGLKVGVIIDQAGSFTVLATAGVIVSSVFSSKEFKAGKIIKDILIYPPFIAFVLGVLLKIFGIQHTEVTKTVLEKLGSLIVILALISVGLQLKISVKEVHFKEMFTGLFFKLLLAPAVIYFLYFIIAKERGLIVDVSLIESAMPPMVMGAVMAVSYDLNPKLANLMVGIGIPLSALTLLFWYFVIT